MSNGSMRTPSAIWWIVPITALLLFWILNLVMPLNADDFGCKVFCEKGTAEIMTSSSQLMQCIQKEFFSYNARLGNIYYRFSLTFLPQWLNDFIVTLWVGGLIFVLLRIALRRKIQPTGFDMTLWLGILSVIFLPLQAVENFISYTSGLYNYMPGGVGTLLVLDKISHWFIEGEDDAPGWWLYPVSFVSGWSNEVYGFFMIPFFGLLVFWRVVIEKKPLPSWVFFLMFSFTLGFGFLVFAPGTHARASIQPEQGSFFALFITSAFLYVSFALLPAPFCVGVVLMLLLFMRKEELISRREKVFFPLLLISTAGIIPAAALGGFLAYGRALWATHLVLGIILVWGVSRLMNGKVWLVTFPVIVGALALFGTLIWNTYIVRAEFERVEQAFLEAGQRGEKVLLVDFPALRTEPHSTIMRLINRVVLVQRDPEHWLNRGLVKYYNALHGERGRFKGPSYIVLDNLVPPHLNRYAFDTKNDPLNRYPEIRSLIEQQKTINVREGGQ
jgi:hypothetical protein